MAPLIALGVSFLPQLAGLLFGERAGRVTESVAAVVTEVTGTSDPAAAKAKLDADPALASQLRIRLAEIATEGERLRLEFEEKRRQAELEVLKEQLRNTQGARTTMADLSKGGSALAWAPAVVSIVVTAGFFFLVWRFIDEPVTLDQNAVAILNIAIGAMVAAFTAVVNFWLGSSQGSRDKDATVRQLQESARQQNTEAVRDLTAQTQSAIQGLTQVATTASAAPPPAPLAATPVGLRVGAAAAPVKRRAFDQAIELVLDKEGGFSDHPRDKGGPTNFGITFRTYAAFHDIDPATVTPQMMRDLKREEAVEIYRTNYWTAARCDALPPGVDLCVFDFGVNAGVRTAIRLLQEVAGVTKDGSIGPITLAAVAACEPATVIRQFAEKRLAYYRSLDDFDVFGKGWTARTVAIREAALRIAEEAGRPVAVMA